MTRTIVLLGERSPWALSERDMGRLVEWYDRLPHEKRREFWQLRRREDKIVFLLRWGSFEQEGMEASA